MTLAERNASVEEDKKRLDDLIAEIGAIDEEIRGRIGRFSP